MSIFKPRKVSDDDLYGKDGYSLYLMQPNIYQFLSRGASSNIYLILGDDMTVLIDSGLVTQFNSFNYLLTQKIGISVEEIDLIINTHAHFDHFSTNCFFHCPIAAHRWCATKITHSDELITKAKKHQINLSDFRINIWLENRTIFDLGGIFLKIFETPGHTSGSICIYEPYQHYIFTGDTFFKGTESNIYESGSISELINSLQILNTLKIKAVYPGHGRAIVGIKNVQEELNHSIENNINNLDKFVKRVHGKPIKDLKIPPSLYNRDEPDL